MTIALDVHVHAPEPPHDANEDERQMDGRFGIAGRPSDPEELYQTYKDLDIKAVIFGLDREATGGPQYML